MNEEHVGDKERGVPGQSRRVVTAAMVAAAMMAAQAAGAGYAEAQATTGGPVPPSPSPGPIPPPPSPGPGFDSKKECKQFFKQDGKLTKKEKKKCNKMFD